MNKQQDFKSSDYGVDFGSLAKLFSEGQNTRILAAKQQDEINNAKLLSQAIKLNTSKDNNIDLNKALFDYTNVGGNPEQGLKTLLGLHQINTGTHDPMSLLLQREALKDAREEKRLGRQSKKDELEQSNKIFDIAKNAVNTQVSPDTFNIFGNETDQTEAQARLLQALTAKPDKQSEILSAFGSSINEPSGLLGLFTDRNVNYDKFNQLVNSL